MNTQNPSDTGQQANRRYLTVWRWHFYFGLLVAPFLTLLAVTGLGMLLFANITGKEGERLHVTPQAQVQPLSAQAEAARQFVNEKSASVVQYIAPRADDMVAVFRIADHPDDDYGDLSVVGETRPSETHAGAESRQRTLMVARLTRRIRHMGFPDFIAVLSVGHCLGGHLGRQNGSVLEPVPRRKMGGGAEPRIDLADPRRCVERR